MSANNNITVLAQNTKDSIEKAAAISPKINFLIAKPPQPVKLDDGRKALPEDSSLASNSALTSKVTTNTNLTDITGTPSSVSSQANSLTEAEGDNKKKRKRSRWDQAGSSKIPSIAAKETGHIETVLPGHTQSSSSSTSSPLFSNRSVSMPTSSVRSASPQVYTSSDKRQFSNFSDTYKPGMVRVGSKWVYPEDEITDGGTWEHKKRAEEMKKTADQAALLTAQAEAKRAHHIADFLPKEELEKFQSKVKAVKAGGVSPEYEDYSSNKLDQSNIGFKMLMKQGWQAGEGLGKSSDGIAAPINKAESRPTNAGLGQTKPDGVEEEDDEFEIYRKRMMLAYRFRPNPLNNPRRPYY